ncbi:MAG TPA: response regulator [Thermoanaerobaculia bacterium]|nr:response regulator [Thermoanaerobaculia bacterium]
MNVLIIDDEDDVRRIATLSLGRVGGMDVIEASNGQDGIDQAEAHTPDVILLDMMMPGMDGASTFHALRANAKTAAIPIIFLTTKTTGAEQLGARGVMLKPFNPMTLADEVRAVLAR